MISEKEADMKNKRFLAIISIVLILSFICGFFSHFDKYADRDISNYSLVLGSTYPTAEISLYTYRYESFSHVPKNGFCLTWRLAFRSFELNGSVVPCFKVYPTLRLAEPEPQ